VQDVHRFLELGDVNNSKHPLREYESLGRRRQRPALVSNPTALVRSVLGITGNPHVGAQYPRIRGRIAAMYRAI
jgi:hypothetical protein